MAFMLEARCLCISLYIIKSSQGIISEREAEHANHYFRLYCQKMQGPLFKVITWLLSVLFVHIHRQWKSIKEKN